MLFAVPPINPNHNKSNSELGSDAKLQISAVLKRPSAGGRGRFRSRAAAATDAKASEGSGRLGGSEESPRGGVCLTDELQREWKLAFDRSLRSRKTLRAHRPTVENRYADAQIAHPLHRASSSPTQPLADDGLLDLGANKHQRRGPCGRARSLPANPSL